MSRDITESEKQGKGIAEDVRTSVDKASKCLNGWDVQSKHIQPENGIAESLYSGECRGGGGESYVMQSRAISFQERAGKPGGGKEILIQKDRTGALSTLNNQSVLCIQGNCIDRSDTAGCNGKGWRENESYTLNTIDRHAVAYRKKGHPQNAEQGQGFDNWESRTPTVVLENHPNDSRVKIREDGTVQTLSSRMGTGGGNVPMVMEEPTCTTTEMTPKVDSKGVAFSLRSRDYKDPQCVTYANEAYDKWSESEKGSTLRASGGVYGGGSESLSVNSVVRRLTPLECERLQGYPDGWTDIGEWYDSKGKKHKNADSPRYKALGNSIALPFWQWMAERMCKYIENPTMASLFDGIGGFPLVYSRCGCVPVWASEIEEFPIAVTRIRFPEGSECELKR